MCLEWNDSGNQRLGRSVSTERGQGKDWLTTTKLQCDSRAYSGVLLHRRLTREEKNRISKGPEHRILEGFELKRNNKCLRYIGLPSFEITHYIHVPKHHIATHKCNRYMFFMFIKIKRASEMAHPIKMFS